MEPNPRGHDVAAQVAALGELGSFERVLDARTAGVAIIVAGLALAGVLLSYEAWNALLDEGNYSETLAGLGAAVLWVPWVAGAYLVTWLLWRMNSLSGKRGGAQALKMGSAFFVAYLVLGLVWLIVSDLLPLPRADISTKLMVVNALFALVVGVAFQWAPAFNWRSAGVPMMVVGGALALVAMGLYAQPYFNASRDALVAAIATVASFLLAGLYTYRRG